MKKNLKRILFGIIFILLAAILFFKLSPYPSVWITRYYFHKGAEDANNKLAPFVSQKISSQLNVSYDPNDKDAYLDIYYHQDSVGARSKLPAIIWTHGGGLISGNKTHISNYSKLLAEKGYVTISIDYTVAPEKKYPTPLAQLNKALEFISKNADRYYIDNTRLVLGGDSGGSMISAQVANIISNPGYAKLVGINSTIQARQIMGLLLYCGIYDAGNLKAGGKFGSFLETVLWSYFGKKNIAGDGYAQTASVINYLTSSFPPSFISAGNGDPLLGQSKMLAKALLSKNVYTDTLFYPPHKTPALAHEYQFTFNEEGKLAFERSLEFLQKVEKGK